MTRRANQIIEVLKREGRVAGLSPEVMLRVLRTHGLRPAEAGWILNQVLGISMPEAVHRAEIVGTHRDSHRLADAPQPEELRDQVDPAGAVRLVAG